MGTKKTNKTTIFGVGYEIILIIVAAIIIAGIGMGWIYESQQNQIDTLNQEITSLTRSISNLGETYTSTKGVTVKVYIPKSNETLESPFYVIGQVPGGWSFEGSFTVNLKDQNGTIVSQAIAHLHDKWTTDALVPFTAKLTAPANLRGTDGTLVLERDNASGLPTNNDSVSIPVKF